MKYKQKFGLLLIVIISGSLTAFIITNSNEKPVCCINQKEHVEPKGCVFKTVMGEEELDSEFIYPIPGKVENVIKDALTWTIKAQLNDGGWGAGYNHNQSELNPHQVKSDPATSALVGMALLRCHNTLTAGEYSNQLKECLHYLLQQVENSNPSAANITTITGSQPQVKLGANIDVVLTSQFLSNILDYLKEDEEEYARIKKCLAQCVTMIEKNQNTDGSFKDDGWAGVLQSSYSNNALESAQKKGIKVNQNILDKSREYQKGNYNAKNGDVKTDKGAGVMLYAVSSTSRGSAEEAREVKEKVNTAKKEGKLRQEDKINVDNLKKIGMADDQAYKYATAYEVNEAAKVRAQDESVMSGFGNNGGEEFLSFLQTGEGLIIAKDDDWKKWYDKVSAKLLTIQNKDGSWNGHHCITSPVFCTATCLLILSINNDIANLQKPTASR